MIELDGDWQLALDEIVFPKTWYNVGRDEVWFEISPAWNRVALRPGYYPTVASLYHAFDAEMKKARIANIALVHNHNSSRISIAVQRGFRLRLSSRLKNLLGFESEYVDSGMHKSTRGIDVDENRQLLFIYCNVLDSRIVGGSFAPVLAVVDSQGRYGSVIHKHYNRPRYHDVQKKRFDTITTHIKDATGKAIPFETDRVIASLHLRKHVFDVTQ